MDLRVGTSGFAYKSWKGSFYPANLPASRWLDHYAGEGRKALHIPIGGSDEIGIWGYLAACEELAADFTQAGIEQAHVVTATGSGGTLAGMTTFTL